MSPELPALPAIEAIGPERQALLAAIADVMIPPGDEGGMPSGSEGGVHEAGLEAVLAARPDLLGPLLAALDAAAGLDGEAAVATLRENDGHWGTIQQVVAAGYFLVPETAARLGYPGQEVRPVANEPVDPNDPLIESVRARGPVFRPTVVKGS